MISIDLTQAAAQTALRGFLLSVLPAGVEVVEAQDNRVAEPQTNDFVSMNTIRRTRLSTNVVTFADCAFMASISGVNMTVTEVAFGAIIPGNILFGIGVTAGTSVTAQQSGPSGGAGVYTVSNSLVVGPETMATGTIDALQPTEVVWQLDIHGDNSGDNAQVISTLFRSEYATAFFSDANPLVAPLYADEPKQIPFSNDQNQIEDRWIVDAHLQNNATILVPQQYAGTLTVGLIEVDTTYPA